MLQSGVPLLYFCLLMWKKFRHTSNGALSDSHFNFVYTGIANQYGTHSLLSYKYPKVLILDDTFIFSHWLNKILSFARVHGNKTTFPNFKSTYVQLHMLRLEQMLIFIQWNQHRIKSYKRHYNNFILENETRHMSAIWTFNYKEALIQYVKDTWILIMSRIFKYFQIKIVWKILWNKRETSKEIKSIYGTVRVALMTAPLLSVTKLWTTEGSGRFQYLRE